MIRIKEIFSTAALAVAALAVSATVAQAGPYSARWMSGATLNEREINPIVYDNGGGNFRTAAQYYSYNTPFASAANTPDNLERSETATMFLYNDPNTGLSLFHIYDQPNDATGLQVRLDIVSTGLAGTGQSFIVRDDPGDTSFGWNDATGSASLNFSSFPCCTDGWVLGLLPDANGDSWAIDVDFTQLTGITQFRVVTLADPFTTQAARVIDDFYIAANNINTLEFVRTAEVTEPLPAPAGLIFPLAVFGLMAVRRRLPIK